MIGVPVIIDLLKVFLTGSTPAVFLTVKLLFIFSLVIMGTVLQIYLNEILWVVKNYYHFHKPYVGMLTTTQVPIDDLFIYPLPRGLVNSFKITTGTIC